MYVKWALVVLPHARPNVATGTVPVPGGDTV
jgi:hypothetical protein